MQNNLVREAARQAEICNACRYCEGYCSVFPALHELRNFTETDISYLANLCHDCRACYYACQYTAPHEFDMNIPKVFAQARHKTWQDYAWPRGFAKIFYRSSQLISLMGIIGVSFFIALFYFLPKGDGEGFYAIFSHNIMMMIFLPAFLFPVLSLYISLRRFWLDMGGGKIDLQSLKKSMAHIRGLKDLAAGHGDGCNFEEEDRFSHARRYAHQAILYGFLLCFASTTSATILHYGFDIQAPYGLLSIPKMFGIPGGVMMVFGCVWMFHLKRKSERQLGDAKAWSAEMAFVLLLGLIALSGLLLYILGKTALMPPMLILHLACVLTFFLLTPYSKMAHGFYRLLALFKKYTD